MQESFTDKDHRAVADLVRIDKGEYLLTRINVPPMFRRKGVGNKLLRRVLAAADEHNVTVVLEVSGQRRNGLNYSQLVSWYKRNGFIQGPLNIMYRLSKEHQEMLENEGSRIDVPRYAHAH